MFDKRDIHVHVPEGATPKDGPSAGVAMVTAIVSVMTGIPVYRDVAMTGEITLRGRVLPIGGLKEKLLAAHRGGIKTVLIPEENAKDLVEINDSIKSGLDIIPVSRMDEVLARALVRKPEPIVWEESTAKPVDVPDAAVEEDSPGLPRTERDRYNCRIGGAHRAPPVFIVPQISRVIGALAMPARARRRLRHPSRDPLVCRNGKADKAAYNPAIANLYPGRTTGLVTRVRRETEFRAQISASSRTPPPRLRSACVRSSSRCWRLCLRDAWRGRHRRVPGPPRCHGSRRRCVGAAALCRVRPVLPGYRKPLSPVVLR